ncbi:MAG: MFS transporter [Anaerolineae bacterium]|nr:MFS transporter [Anaerolineae bacterium]
MPLTRAYRRLSLVAAGGRWVTQLPRSERRTLRWLTLDGLLASISDALLNTYQSLYLLALGATKAQIGALSSLANLAMPLAMIPGGRLAGTARRFKPLVIVPALGARLALLALAGVPFLTGQVRAAVILAITLVVSRAFLTHLFNPAWTTMLGGIVPVRWRGRYFSTRNIVMGLAGFLALLTVGQLMDRISIPAGYQLALALSALAGFGSLYAFSRLQEPALGLGGADSRNARPLLQVVRGNRRFLGYCGAALLWNMAVQIAGPFFIVYLVSETGASSSLVGAVSAAATLAALPGQRLFGLLTDRKGAQWVQRVTGFVIPLVPGIWGFIQQPWQAFPVQIISGFAWAGYNLASFSLLLDMTPDADRPRFVALYQAIVGLGMAAGAALGGWIAETFGYRPLFLASAGGRLSAAVVFSILVAGRKPKFPGRVSLHLGREWRRHLRKGE